MKRRTISALVTIGLLCGAAAAQQDPFARLKTYDSQQRQPVEELRITVQRSLNDPAKRAEVENGLIAVLNDRQATFAGKQEACRLLWMLGADRSVAVLTQLLAEDATADIARYGLERSPAPGATTQLIAALKEAKGKTAVGIINTLGNRGDADAAPAIQPFAVNADRATADAAIVALGKIGTPVAVAILEKLPGQGLLVRQALLRAGDRLAASGKKAEAVRIYSAQASAGGEVAVQVAALRRLAVVSPAQGVTSALSALTAPDRRVAVTAASIAGALADSQTVGKNTNAWASLPAAIQVPLLAALTVRKEQAAIRLATRALDSDDEMLRVTAVQALAAMAGPRITPVLAKIIATKRGEERNAARTALIQMPGADGDGAILKEAKSGDPASRRALMGILAERGTPQDIASLMESAAGADEALAVEALKALDAGDVRADSAALIRILTTTPSESVRDAAQATLVANARRANGVENATIAALSGATVPARVALLGTLAQVGGDTSLAELTKATTDTTPEIKTAAITALAETWNDSRPLPTLLTVAKSEPNRTLRIQALRGYFRLLGQDEKMPAETRVAQAKAGMAAAERPEEKQQALGVLRECRIPAAVELAAASLADDGLFDTASDTVLYLAAEQKKGDATLPAVKGAATTQALQTIIQRAKDPGVKAQAQKLL